jgi:hypothetical protein
LSEPRLGKDHRGGKAIRYGGKAVKCPECGSRIPAKSTACPSCRAGLSPDRRPDPKEGGTGNEQRLAINNYGIPIVRENLKGVIFGLIVAIAVICIIILLAFS